MSNTSGRGAGGPAVPPRRSKGGKGGGTARSAAPPVNRPPRNRPSKAGRPRRPPWLLYGLPAAVIVAIIVVVVVLVTSGGSSSNAAHETAVGWKIGTTPVYGQPGPEGVPLQLGPVLAPASTGLTGAPIDGIQCSSSEQLAYHHHVHVVIFVNGQPRSIPLGIGMVPPVQVQRTANGDFAAGSPTCLYWIHVHAQDGIVHIESPNPKTPELGQFFNIWGQPISSSGIGSVKGAVTATVNGTPWSGDPANIPMTEHAQIVINVGTPARTPPPISWSGTQL